MYEWPRLLFMHGTLHGANLTTGKITFCHLTGSLQLHGVSVIDGMEYGMKWWNGIWNGGMKYGMDHECTQNS